MYRPALRYTALPHLNFFMGYLWNPQFYPTFKNENRLWQQILLSQSASMTEQSYRLRVEQRWIESTTDVSWRLRLMLRTILFFDHDKAFGLCLSDEYLQNVNDADPVVSAGFDQNRLFLGFNLRFTQKVQLDIGYQHVYLNRPLQPTDLITHTALLYAYILP
jgi:hypothetical protein